MNQETRICQNCKKDFVVAPEDFAFYENMQVPQATFCPECRLRRRLAFRNERTIYKRTCDLCKKEIVSIYHKKSLFTVYCPPCWWSDKWDTLSYGRAYDFSKPFFLQFQELMRAVPRLGLVIKQSTDSDYTNYSFENKNVYLSFAMHYNEDCGYLNYSTKCKDSFDCRHVSNAELAYECNYCDRISNSSFLQYCFSCFECILGYNLRNCEHCFGCVNLRNKQYHIFNKPYTKEAYMQKISEYTGSFEGMKKARTLFHELSMKLVKPWGYQVKCTQSIGNDLEECNNLYYAFGVKFSEDSRYAYVNNVRIFSCMDVNHIGYDRSEFCYDCEGLTGSSNVKFTSSSFHNTFLAYCNLCFTSNYGFGSIGLRDKKYCILNKQYSQETYNQLIPKIISHMNEMPYRDKEGNVYRYGEFFPQGLSAFAYNESIAQEYFPLTKEEALGKGYQWKDPESKDYQVTVTNDKIPDRINNAPDKILNEVIKCKHEGTCNEQCTFAFRIIPQELKFYQTMSLPLPRLCPNCRHYERLKARNPQKLWHNGCQCAGKTDDQRFKTNDRYKNTAEHFHKVEHCPNKFQTTYSSEQKEIVYCEACYVAEVA